MTFYIKPPSGTTHLENLETYTLKRMTFLLRVDECESGENEFDQQLESTSINDPQCSSQQGPDPQGGSAESSRFRGGDSLCRFQALLREEENVAYSDCLIEGSRKDRISHFTLRLACSMDQELQHFLLTAEKKLFHFRFSSMNAEELAIFLRSTQKFLSRLLRRSSKAGSEGKLSFLLKSLHDILLKIYNVGKSWEDVAEKYVEGNTEEAVEVPFQCALDLIAQRNVELKAGMALIPISKLDTIISGLFEKVLWHGMFDSQRALDRVLDDERMEDLFEKVCGMFSAVRMNLPYVFSRKRNSVRMNLRDVDNTVEVYPLCMSHLHNTLRRKHRLRHFSRIQYTLFLKDAGLSVNDAIRFWKSEYSRPEQGKDGERRACSHSWSKDAKRYTYSVRHLYGLEGSRINYRSHSCKSIQKMSLGHGEEGGCPYAHFDKWSLATVLTSDRLHPSAAADILLSAKNEQYAEACLKHRVAKFAHLVTDKTVPRHLFGSETNHKREDCFKLTGNIKLEKQVSTCSRSVQQPLQIKREVVVDKIVPHHLFGSKTNQKCEDRSKLTGNIKLEKQISTCSRRVQEPLQIKSEIDEGFPLLTMKTGKFLRTLSPKYDTFEEHPHASTDPECKQFGKSNFSCNNERLIPKKELLFCKREISEMDDKVKDVLSQFHKPITKPTEYYISFQNLLDGLKQIEMEKANAIVTA